MIKRNLNDLIYFIAVAREGNFTRAAAMLGVTQSALSKSVRSLESRLQIRLLTRTTRSVAPTAEGEKLLKSIGQYFDNIESELENLTELRDKPAGKVRITCSDHVLRTILLPKLSPLMHQYPDIRIEFNINYGFTDIVTERFDAGVRLGNTIEKDMIAVPIGPISHMAVVASPEYFSKNPLPKTPRDLTHHKCINQRMVTAGGVYKWEFENGGKKINIRVDGQIVFNTSVHIVDATLAGLGIARLPVEEFSPYLEEGKLTHVLKDWCPSFPGYYLYYPTRRQPSTVFSMVVDALRYRAPSLKFN